MRRLRPGESSRSPLQLPAREIVTIAVQAPPADSSSSPSRTPRALHDTLFPLRETSRTSSNRRDGQSVGPERTAIGYLSTRPLGALPNVVDASLASSPLCSKFRRSRSDHGSPQPRPCTSTSRPAPHRPCSSTGNGAAGASSGTRSSSSPTRATPPRHRDGSGAVDRRDESYAFCFNVEVLTLTASRSRAVPGRPSARRRVIPRTRTSPSR